MPRPEIVGTVVAPFSKGVDRDGGQRDFHPLSANFLLPKWVGTHWAQLRARQGVGRSVVADVADWRIARTIFVADDEATARAYGADNADSPYRFYYQQMLKKMRKLGRIELFKSDRDQPDDEITLEYVLDRLVITGTVDEVPSSCWPSVRRSATFGELVYAGMDWVDDPRPPLDGADGHRGHAGGRRRSTVGA